MLDIHALEAMLVAHDGWELRHIVHAVNAHPQRGVMGLMMTPYLSLYVVEASEWMGRASAGGRVRVPPDRDRLLREVRARIKLFDGVRDGRRHGLGEVIRILGDIERASVGFFNRPHAGLLGPLKRWIQPDLGLFFHGRDLVCTTHVAVVNAGVDPTQPEQLADATHEDLLQRWQRFSHDGLGRFIGMVTDAAAPIVDPRLVAAQIAPCPEMAFSAEDHKARMAYARLGDRLGTRGRPLAAAVTWMVSQVNFVHHVLRRMAPTSCGAFFRIKFITVFHALMGLRMLGASLRDRLDSPMAVAAAALQGHPDARTLRGARPLRKALAHPYDLDEVGTRLVEGEGVVACLVRQLSPWTVEELDAVLDTQLAAMSHEFRHLVPPGALGGTPVKL